MNDPNKAFTNVKVFCATTARDREELSERVTRWIRSRPKGFEIVDRVVRQSSDEAFHCISIVLFYVEPRGNPK